MSDCKLEARQTASASWTVTVDAGSPAALTAGDCYVGSGYSSGASLIANLQAVLAAAVASTTVTLSATTGKITITWGSGSHAMTWGSSVLRNRLGFTGSLASATSHTSQGQAQYLWIPGVNPGGMLSPITQLGVIETDRRLGLARSGAVCVTQFNARRRQRWSFAGLLPAKTWEPSESTTNESAESFWTDAVQGGAAIRYYTDKTSASSYLIGSTAMDYQATADAFAPVRLRGDFDGLWVWAFEGRFTT